MFIALPPSFPKDKFQEFGLLAAQFFPKLLSDGFLSDPLQSRIHLDRSWMAVAYRYRECAEHNEEFKALLRGANETMEGVGSGRRTELQAREVHLRVFHERLVHIREPRI